MTDRTILVTGSTDGIGKQTALELARLGARVLVHGRDPEKGRAVLEEIRKAAGSGRLELFIADLSSQREVRDLAQAVKAKHDRLHVLINNAGTYEQKRVLTADGVEKTFAVNFLAPFLLTHLLLDQLEASSPSRIVTVSSIAHQSVGVVDMDNLQGEKGYDAYEAYALSKLAVIHFTFELAGRLRERGVTANCLHPGVIGTKLLHSAFRMPGAGVKHGAETPVYLAISPEVECVTGEYFEGRHPARVSPLARDAALGKKFWEIGERLTGLA